MSIAKEELIRLYRTMLTIRRFEEHCYTGFASNAIPGVVHSYIGEEACATGVCAALRREDKIVSTHRGHGHCIAKGADIRRMMAEIYGRSTGLCKGKGGSMHIADFSAGMLGANGIVGGGFGIGVGAALACKLDKSDRVAVVFFGDGASREGTFHEGMNLAALWKLPLVFACENNHYGASNHVSKVIPIKDIAQSAAAYDMPSRVVDGNDVAAVYQAAREAVTKARAGEGPFLLEMKTYRWRVHNEAMTALGETRPLEELESWKKRDPLVIVEKRLLEDRTATKSQLEAIDKEARAVIDDAVNFALSSPLPRPEDALTDVFSDECLPGEVY